MEAQIAIGDEPVGGLDDIGVGVEHVEHVGGLHPRALADFEIIEVVARRDLDRARSQFRVGMLVRHHLEAAASDRLENILADHILVARIVGMHGDRHVGEHRFRTRRRDDDMVAAICQRHAIGERIAEAPEAALGLHRLHFQVGNGGAEMRVPVDEALVAIEEAALVQLHEGPDHGLRKALVHGEAFIGPVHGAAQATQLARDRPAAFRLPVPDLGDEILAAIVGALFALRIELTLHHHLRRDAGMVGAHHPQRILAAQPLVADDDVLQRIVERVADMQAAGHIGRRIDDGEGHGVGPVGAEQALLLPMLIPAGLDCRGVEGFRQLGHGCALAGPARRANSPRTCARPEFQRAR